MGQLYIQKNTVSALVNLMFHEGVISTHVKNMTDLESAKKSLAPLYFWKTPVRSDASNSSASGLLILLRS